MVLAAPLTRKELAALAIDRLRRTGCEYGEVRFTGEHTQRLTARDRSMDELSERRSSGFGVRVLLDGAWGFAASHRLGAEQVERTVALAVETARASRLAQNTRVRLVPVVPERGSYITPIKVDPFSVPVEKKAQLLLEINEQLLRYGDQGIRKVRSFLRFGREEKLFASTEGALIEQTIYRSYPGFSCTAVANGDAQERSYERPPLNIGYEHIDAADLMAQTERVATEAIQKVRAPRGPQGVRSTLLLKPSHLFLTIHESVGHPTELDRVYGYEANFAGTSFATTDKLGALRYAASGVNFRADRTQEGGRATCGWDDEGVPAQSWRVVEDGILVDYLTDRETACRLGRAASNGCAFADSWANVPMVRIPNLGLEPGADGGALTATLAEMIADTEAGILIDGIGSYSIDQQRRNFQFGGDAFWKIEKGRIVHMFKDVTYCAMTTDFWNRVDALGPQRELEQWGTDICGKGEPMQIAQMSHACVPVRVRDIALGSPD
ncbi:MAG: TldD/PmbA family protein [Aphanocapsa lilacina HA4352-LM1]|jgi:TldD protein|nr:TldD/PmbA family protein [Aphanocapsa lilacina HA4352-LM1]